MATGPDVHATVFRTATAADVEALAGLERDSNLVALSHVFPGVPFPLDAVRDRWERLERVSEVSVEVAGPAARLDVYLAWDAERLRHLGVRPEVWGRGLARAAVERAISQTDSLRRLWVLRENDRARGLYEHLGWSSTGRDQQAEWPPYPVELEYAR
jgi:GNAT superfamily N-acetyltransferase